MTKKVFNMEGGLHSAAAYSAFENRAYGSCVASTDSFVVTAGTGMNARISAGDGLIDTGLNFARRIQSDAQETVSVEPASTSYNRVDSVVAYIDTAVTPTTSVVDNTNGVLKFASVAGTAASSPQAPSQAAIQSTIGAGNPYMVLFNITVPTNATNLTGATFTDQRNLFNIIKASQVPSGFITNAMLANKSVKYANINYDDHPGYSNLTLTGVTSVSRLIYRIIPGSQPSVNLFGRVQLNSGTFNNSVIGTLPPAARPLSANEGASDFTFPATGAGSNIQRVAIAQATGTVTVTGPTTGANPAGWVDIAITYPVALV